MRAVGIDIGGTSIKAVALDENDRIVQQAETPTPTRHPFNAVQAVETLLQQFCIHGTVPVGIACAGEVDSASGVISADNLGWYKVPFADLLRQHIHLPFVLFQDASAAMEAEIRCGALKNVENGVYLCLGTGIGGDVLMGGKALRKLRSTSSEIGHMIIHAGGLPCPCGNYGCFEQYASATALVRMGGGTLSAKEIASRAQAGDASCLRIWKRYIEELCTGLMNCLVLYAPDVFCLGGGISAAGDFLLSSVRQQMETYSYFCDYFANVRFRTACFSKEAGALGAALLAASMQNGLYPKEQTKKNPEVE